MIEKIGPIKNPLTIIAIFAAIAEISGTVVLPFIVPANQTSYVWFLMIFPILLIVLFFLTLNFNHKVLYAPSDYQNEDNFLRSLPRATLAEKVQKIEAEIEEEETATESQPESGKPLSTSVSVNTLDIKNSKIQFPNAVHRSLQASHILAEELIFRKLSKEFSSEIQREVKLDIIGGRYMFDGIVLEKGITTVIEVKYLRNIKMSSTYLRKVLEQIQASVVRLPGSRAMGLRVLIAFASDEVCTNEDHIRIEAQINRYRGDYSFPIEARLYNLAELEQELQIGP